MKKVLLSAAFILAVTFSFAGENAINNNKGEEITSKEVKVVKTKKVACFGFTLSCGITGTVCGSSTADMLDAIWWADGAFC